MKRACLSFKTSRAFVRVCLWLTPLTRKNILCANCCNLFYRLINKLAHNGLFGTEYSSGLVASSNGLSLNECGCRLSVRCLPTLSLVENPGRRVLHLPTNDPDNHSKKTSTP